MQGLLDHFGVAVAAITGVLAARGKQVDLFGVLVLALVTAFGGGTIRDLMLGDTPVFWARNPSFVLNGTLTAVITFYLARYHEFPTRALLVADAFALALFTIAGARKGFTFSLAPTIVVAMGVITGVAGGIVRDLLIGEIPLVFRPQIYLYATAALCGASLFAVLRLWAVSFPLSILCGTVATLLLRLAGIRWRLTLPLFRSRKESDPPG